MAASYKKLRKTSVAPLHTSADGNEIAWKTVYLDQSQEVAYTNDHKYIAIEMLRRQSTVLLTPCPIWDLWSDLFGSFNLLRGHPWTSKEKFTQSFGNAGTFFEPIPPEPRRMNMLQVFLRAIIIIRSDDVLGDDKRAQDMN